MNQNLYANCQLSDSDADYLWLNCWNFQGQAGGDVYLGDLSGHHLFRGNVTKLTINPDKSAVVEGSGVYIADAPSGGQPVQSDIVLNFSPQNTVSFTVKKDGQGEWSQSNIPVPVGSVIGS